MATAGDWMAGGGRGRRFALRLIVLFLVLAGIACLSYPVIYFLAPERAGLIDDTRAYFGAGTAEGVPTVSQVDCIRIRYGTEYRGMTQWDCRLDLVPAAPAEEPPVPQAAQPPIPAASSAPPPVEQHEPVSTSEELFAGYAEQAAQIQESMDRHHEEMQQYNERMQRELSRLTDPAQQALRMPGYLERELPINRSGQLPTLRRLSAEDEPPRFGAIWGGGELALRWLSFAFISIFIAAFGAACLYAAWVGWRRTRRQKP